jgi:hypothetical protein
VQQVVLPGPSDRFFFFFGVCVKETLSSAGADRLSAHQIDHAAINDECHLLDVMHCEGLCTARNALAAAAQSNASELSLAVFKLS